MKLTRDERDFITAASHTLLNPLTLCRGHLEILLKNPEQLKETLSTVIREIDRMADIVSGLGLLAEIDERGLQLEEIDVELFTHELLAKASTLSPRRWILEGASTNNFVADRVLLSRAVSNLVRNAVQHTDGGDTIAIGGLVSEADARFWVRDTGIGVPVADQGRIHELFTRGENAELRYRGSGLGLAIVAAIAASHGGSVELDSRRGEGSIFTIVIPRRPGSSEQVGH